MVQVIWASSPSTKGTARTLFTNRGGTAGPRERGETKGRFERRRERNRETQRQRQTHRKKNRDREMETETKRERETEADKQRWTQRKKQRRRWRQRCRQRHRDSEGDTMMDRTPPPPVSLPDLSGIHSHPCSSIHMPPSRAYTFTTPRVGPGPSPQGSPCTRTLPSVLALPAALAAKHMYWPESAPVRLSRMSAHEPSGSSMRMW